MGLYLAQEVVVAEQGFRMRVWSSASRTIHDLQYRLARVWVVKTIAIQKGFYTAMRGYACHPGKYSTMDIVVLVIEVYPG